MSLTVHHGPIAPVVRSLFASAVILVTAAACTSERTTEVAVANSCQPVLSTRTTAPLSTITVSAIPTTVADSLVSVIVQSPGGTGPGGLAAAPALFSRNADGSLRVVLPAHPATPMQGGAAQLLVAIGDKTCAPVSITMQALAAAPGTAMQVEVVSQKLLASIAAAFGTTTTALQVPLNQLPPEMLVPGIAQFLLDHPGNPNSLKALLAGTAPSLQGKPVDLQFLDALLAQSGVLAEIQRLADSLAIGAAAAGATIMRPATATATVAQLDNVFATTALNATRTNIASAADLNRLMNVQRFSSSTLAGEQSQQIQSMLGHAMTALSLWPPAATATTVVGTLIYFYGILSSGFQALLPSELVSLTVVANPTTFNEDAKTAGRWGSAQLTARSQTWTISFPTVADGLLTAFGGTGIVLKRAMERFPWLKTAFEHAVSELTQRLLSIVTNYAGGTGYFTGSGYAAGPFTYGPVDVTSAPWTTATILASSVVQLGADHFGYTPVNPGTADLVVRTDKQFFAGKALEKVVPLIVKQLTIDLQPASSIVRPGEQLRLTPVVRNADNDAVTWAMNAGRIDADGTDGIYTAPEVPGTYTVTITSVAKPARKATATIQVKDVITVSVSPSITTVAPNGKATFTATVSGTPNQSVTWSAQGGAITQSGVYTAPGTEGTYTVVAVSSIDPTRQGTARVTVEKPATTTVVPGATLAVEDGTNCALDTAGAAWCWGTGESGQLGNGRDAAPGGSYYEPTPVAVSGGHTFVAIVPGSRSFCALTPEGAAYCWGSNAFGMLGNGLGNTLGSRAGNSNVPVAVSGGLTFKSISASLSSVCGITTANLVYCWGSAQNGVFGSEIAASTTCPFGQYCSTPQIAPALTSLDLRSVSVGYISNNMCGISSAGQTYCWGIQYLGDGINHASPTGPVAVPGLANQVSVGESRYASCALATSGAVSCWGNSLSGEFGNGVERQEALSPIAAANGMRFATLTVGDAVICGLTAAGAAYCWGSNTAASLGSPQRPCPLSGYCALTPTPVTGGRTYGILVAGPYSTCGITTAGDAICWGYYNATPVPVGGGIHFKIPTPVVQASRATIKR